MPMSFFIRKAILCRGRLDIRASRAQYQLHFMQNSACASILFSSKCSSNDANNLHSFTVSYLINSCGFSLESALSASKRLHFETPDKPKFVLDFLQNHGFSKSQITIVTKKFPQVLLSSPEKTLSPKLEYFYSKGISIGDVAKMLCLFPFLLGRSLENQIIPKFNYLSDLFQSSEKTVALVKRYPTILYNGVENDLGPNIKILRDNGVPESNIVKFIGSWPQYMEYRSPQYFEKKVADVKKMGIDPLRSQFIIAIIAKCVLSESQWEIKLDVYKKWGWSEEEWLAAFAKLPWCMITSVDKITAAFDFFVNKMGWKSAVIAKYPLLITFSLEKRIIPRVAVIQFMLTKGLIKESTNFAPLLHYSEKRFLEKFLNRYDKAPQLLKLYQEKLALSNKSGTGCSA